MKQDTTVIQTLLTALTALCGLYALISGGSGSGGIISGGTGGGGSVLIMLAATAFLASGLRLFVAVFRSPRIDFGLSLFGAAACLAALKPDMGGAVWGCLVASWLQGWLAVDKLISGHAHTKRLSGAISLMIPVFFGFWLLLFWQALTVGLSVPTVLLPPPSMIAARIVNSTDILLADFQQTFLKAVVAGYLIGCGSAVLVAVLVDRNAFLRRGLLPFSNFISALPIVGIAPIMVMWFGFDWQSKAAVIVLMVFFPMMVNTLTGLEAASQTERDLLNTYAAGYWQSLFRLRLPAAMPFIFNALKINSTLALIGAIVAEFFGTPIVGIGFRISTEVGRMNLDMVWAEIAVAAVAGSATYGVISLIERRVTFWHPSYHLR